MNFDDDSPVLRGGIPDEGRWYESVLDAIDEGSLPVLSVFSDNSQELESNSELIRRIATTADIKHGKIAVTTAGEIRAMGLSLEYDTSDGQSENQFHIVFPNEPSIIEVGELVDLFGTPFPNPYR